MRKISTFDVMLQLKMNNWIIACEVIEVMHSSFYIRDH